MKYVNAKGVVVKGYSPMFENVYGDEAIYVSPVEWKRLYTLQTKYSNLPTEHYNESLFDGEGYYVPQDGGTFHLGINMGDDDSDYVNVC